MFRPILGFCILFFAISILKAQTNCPEPKIILGYCGADEFCFDEEVCMLISADNPSIISRFRLDWGDGSPEEVFTTAGERTHTYDVGGDCSAPQRFIITLIGEVDCPDSTVKDQEILAPVLIVPAPDASGGFMTDPSQLCWPENEIQLNYQSCPPFGPNAQVCYSINGANTICEPNPTLTFPQPGTYTIGMEVITQTQDGKVCGSSSVSQPFTVFESTLADVLFVNTPGIYEICTEVEGFFRDRSQFSDTGRWELLPSNPGNYTINHNDQDSLKVVFHESGTYTLRYIAFSDECGEDIFEETILVEEAPRAILNTDRSDCEEIRFNPRGDLTISPVNDSLMIQWNLGSNGTSNMLDPGIQTWTQNDIITVTAMNQCGTVSDTGRIRIGRPSTAAVVFENNSHPTQDEFIICSLLDAVFLSESLNNTDGDWRITGPATPTIITENRDSLIVEFRVPGTYNLRYQSFSPNCPPDQFEKEIIVEPSPLMEFPLDEESCGPLSLNPADFLTIDPSSGTVDISWMIGNDTFTGPNPGEITFDSSQTIVVIGTNDCGTQDVSGNVGIGTQSTAQFEFTNNMPLPDTAFFICAGVSAEFQSTSINNEDGFWVVSGTNGQRNITVQDMDMLHVEFLESGSYTIEYHATSPFCPESVASIELIVSESPTISLALDQTECESLQLNPSDFLSVSPEDVNIRWEFTTLPSVNGADPGTINFTETNTVTAIGSNACGSTSAVGNIQIIVPQPAAISIPANVASVNDTVYVCANEPNCIPFTATPLGASWFGDFVDNGCFDVAAAGLGAHTIRYGGDCIPDDELTVIVLGEAIDYTVQDSVCRNDGTVLFTAVPNIGEWYASPNTIITDRGQLSPANVPGPSTTVFYEYEIRNLLETCFFTDSFDVEVVDIVVDFEVTQCTNVSGGVEVCFMLGASATQNGRVKYDFGDGSSEIGENICHVYATGGDYEVIVSIEKDGCQEQITRTISIEPPAEASFNSTPIDTVCFSAPLTLENTSTGGNGTYAWFLNDSLISNEVNPGQLLLPSGPNFTAFSHNIRLEAYGGCGDDQEEIEIVSLPGLEASFGREPAVACEGDTIFLNNDSQGISDLCTWTLDGTPFAPECDSAQLILPAGTYSVQLIIENACQTDTIEKSFEILDPNTIALFELDTTEVCLGDTIRAFSFSSPANAFLTWELIDGTDGSTTFDLGRSTEKVFNNPGTHLVRHMSRLCGVDTFQREVVVHPNPRISLEHDPSACEGIPISFTATANVPDFELFYTPNSSVRALEFDHVYTDAGNYDIRFAARSIIGCTNELNSSLEIFPKPRAAIDSIGLICHEQAYTFSGQTDIAINQNIWKFFIDPNNPDRSLDRSPTYTFDSPGEYDICLIVETAQSCLDTVWTTATVEETPVSHFVIDGTPACAPANDVPFINMSTSSTQLTDSYTWMQGTTVLSTQTSPNLSFPDPGIYNIDLIARSLNGCENIFTDQMEVLATPMATILADYEDLCAPMEVNLAFADTDYATIEWRVDGGLVSENPSFLFPFTNTNSPQVLTLELSNGDLCVDADTMEFAPVIRPTANFDVIQDGNHDREIELINQTLDATNYLWRRDTTLFSDEENPVYTFPEPGQSTFYLFAFNGPDCVDTAFQDIAYFEADNFWFPNAFTPNDDGINDEFSFAVQGVTQLETIIVNRWGQTIFRSNDLNPKWDGTFQGRPVQEGVYVVMINATLQSGETLPREARSITLIR